MDNVTALAVAARDGDDGAMEAFVDATHAEITPWFCKEVTLSSPSN